MRQAEHDMGGTRSALRVICPSYDEFFEAEKKVADYMMKHRAEVVDMVVSELARAGGTSDATVSRFYGRCGFKGFHSLKLALAREVLEEEQMDRNVSNDINRDDLRQSLQNMLVDRAAELAETVNMMDPANLEHTPGRLEHVRMVQLAAVGDTIPVALNGTFRFNRLGIPAVARNIWETQTTYTFSLGQGGVVMIVPNSGNSKRLQTSTEGAKENGCTVILITNNGNSPLARICDYEIVTITKEKLSTGEFWFSRATVTAVVETPCLLLRAGMKGPMGHIRHHEEAIPSDKK